MWEKLTMYWVFFGDFTAFTVKILVVKEF